MIYFQKHILLLTYRKCIKIESTPVLMINNL